MGNRTKGPKRVSAKPGNHEPGSGGFVPEAGVPDYIFQQKPDSSFGPGIATLAVAVIGMLGAYLVAESALASLSHPLHWVAAVFGAVAGGVIGSAGQRLLGRSD